MKKRNPHLKQIFRTINLDTNSEKDQTIQSPSTQPLSIELEPTKIRTKFQFDENLLRTETKSLMITSPPISSLVKFNAEEEDQPKLQEPAKQCQTNKKASMIDKKPKSILSDFYLPKIENLDEFKFKFGVFAETMIYQLIFFFLLGPFIHILLLIPFINKNVLRNLQLLGIPGLLQSIQWALLMVILILYIFDAVTNNRIRNVYAIELYDPFLITLIRIIFLSSKYALSSPRYIQRFRSQTLNTRELINEFVIISALMWKDPANVEELVQQSILRLKTDTSAFYFTFIGHDPLNKPSEKPAKASTLQHLMQKTVGKAKFSRSLNKVHPMSSGFDLGSTALDHMGTLDGGPKSKPLTVQAETIFKDFVALMSKHHALENEMLSGYALSTEIVHKIKNARGKKLWIFGVALGVIRALLPLFSRLYEENTALPASKIEISIAISTMLSTFWLFSLNYLVASVSLIDLKQKLLLLNQTTTLLPSYQGRDINRCTPPLNIFNPISLKSWETFRDIFTDYGNEYHTKDSCDLTMSLTNLTVSLGVYLLQLFFILLYFLNIIKFKIGVGNAVVLIYEVAVVLGVFALLLAQGAQINDLFGVHRSRLLHAKRIFSNMIVMRQHYLEKKEIETDHPLIQQGIEYFKQIFPDDEDFSKNCVMRLDQLSKIMDGMIENIDANSEENPVKVFGFRVSWEAIKGLAVFLITIGIAIYDVQSDV